MVRGRRRWWWRGRLRLLFQRFKLVREFFECQQFKLVLFLRVLLRVLLRVILRVILRVLLLRVLLLRFPFVQLRERFVEFQRFPDSAGAATPSAGVRMAVDGLRFFYWFILVRVRGGWRAER